MLQASGKPSSTVRQREADAAHVCHVSFHNFSLMFVKGRKSCSEIQHLAHDTVVLAKRTLMVCRGAIRTMMVTGDYHSTAIAVARGAGMIPGDSRVVIIQSQTEIRPSCRHTGCMHSALKCNKSAVNTPLTPKRAVSFHISKANEQERTCEGLKFLLDNGDAFEDGDALSALTSIAQVMLLHIRDTGALCRMTNALGLSCPASHREAPALSPSFLGSTKTLPSLFSSAQHDTAQLQASLSSGLLRSRKNIRVHLLPWCVRLGCDSSSATCLTPLDMISSHTHATDRHISSRAPPARTPTVHHTLKPLSPRMSVRPCRGRHNAASQDRRFSTCCSRMTCQSWRP